MVLMVANHYRSGSGLNELIFDTITFKSVYFVFITSFGKTIINSFMMITGYFMCTSSFNIRKFWKLFFEIEFYRVFFYFFFVIIGYEGFSVVSCARSILPIESVTNNYADCFLLFYLFIPFLNILIHNLNRANHRVLVLLLLSIYVLLGTIPWIPISFNYITWFSCIYIIASYLRLYPIPFLESKRNMIVITAVLYVTSCLSVIVCRWIGEVIGREDLQFWFLSDSNKMLAVALGISSFMLIKSIRIKYNRFINLVAKSTFGVLLFHSISDTMRSWLWGDVFHNLQVYETSFVYIHLLAVVVCVYIVGTLFDMGRIYFIETRFLKVWDKTCRQMLEHLQLNSRL